jgi:hypothetical protein
MPTEFEPAADPSTVVLYGDDDETLPPRRAGILDGDDEDETILPSRRARGGRFLDPDEIDETIIEREEAGLMGWMIVKASPFMRRGHAIRVRPGSIWGRDPRKADVVIDDDKVSGIHARIQLRDDHFILIDLGSGNGTSVNGDVISAATSLNQDDEVKMGDTVFVLKTLA